MGNGNIFRVFKCVPAEEGESKLSLQPWFLKCGKLYDSKTALLRETAERRGAGVKLNKLGAARGFISHEKTLGNVSPS